ncbi:MAG: DUF370 domain-containing protein [Clostridia bacterium]|nr:DUF370 domain-containing protein [Clostridia bacterium]
MYINIGAATVLRTENIVGIFDMDNTTVSARTRRYLNTAEKEGKIINVAEDIPKSFVVVNEDGENIIYLSQLSTSTLLKRTNYINYL